MHRPFPSTRHTAVNASATTDADSNYAARLEWCDKWTSGDQPISNVCRRHAWERFSANAMSRTDHIAHGCTRCVQQTMSM